ncbi:MAG: alanine racemase [bacterium]|nr:alanine racemase [bacterium]
MKKVWVEISRSALSHNLKVIRRHLSKGVQVLGVVKSNAYGHGIYAFSKLADRAGVDGFCVDSVPEAIALRREKIKKPILVLGPTLPNLMAAAARAKVSITASNWETLKALSKMRKNQRPDIHLKIDTGMYRQGFYVSQLPEVLDFIRRVGIVPVGMYSHFADSAETDNATFTAQQYQLFSQAIEYVRGSGFPDQLLHIANTAAALTNKRYQLDAIRVGNGLYGLYPSSEYEKRAYAKLKLHPVLSWHALVSEIKKVPNGGAIGYGRTKIAPSEMTIALIPIGFWHGLPWNLSNNGEVLISGKRASIVGRVSMDMIAVDITGLKCKVGSRATFIGTQDKETITAREVANWLHTRPQEIVTRINPLIERVVTP